MFGYSLPLQAPHVRECVPNEKTNGKGNYALFSLILFTAFCK